MEHNREHRRDVNGEGGFSNGGHDHPGLDHSPNTGRDQSSALKELLYQLADDDFILGYRGSEWLGLAPHIEEDVAFSSISQNTMGHAVMFYQLLESLGEGKADDIAHLRKPEVFRNAVLLERPNGPGHYMENPQYDWAYAVVRHYVYDLFKTVRLESLSASSYIPIKQLAIKILREEKYHLLHWEAWLKQMYQSTDTARMRIDEAIHKTWQDVDGLFSLGEEADSMVSGGLIESSETLKKRWTDLAKKHFAACGIQSFPSIPKAQLDGRRGEHTDALADALQTLSEVYRQDPAANW